MSSYIRAENSRLPSNEQSSSLPEEIILDILARVPRCDYPTVSLVSKHFRSLVSSPDIYERRSSLRCTEHCIYVVLNDDRLYTLHRKANGKRSLVPIPWLPAMPDNGSFVAVGSRIYVFGGQSNHDMTLSAFSIDCRSHIVQRLPNMPVRMSYSIADVIDRRIYVFGHPCGFKSFDSTVVLVVFNTETQMWEPGMTKLDMEVGCMWTSGYVAMAGKMYTRDFVYDPKESKWETDHELLDSNEWMDACVIDDVMYYYDIVENKLLAYDFEQSCWRLVRGLEELLAEMKGVGFSETVRYGEKLVVWFSKGKLMGITREIREICCAEISLERLRGGQIRGKVEWCDHGLIAGDFYVLKPLTVMV